MAWFEKHVTGTPEANARLEAAEEALENYKSGDGSANDKEFVRLNEAAHKAAQDVPAPRRGGWI